MRHELRDNGAPAALIRTACLRRFRKTIQYLRTLAFLALAACGGAGGGGGPAPVLPGDSADPVDPVDPAVPPVAEVERIPMPDGVIISPQDYLGKTFPFLYASRTERPSGDVAAAGLGAIEILDADTIVLRLPGADPVTLRLAPPSPGQLPGFRTFTDGADVEIIFKDEGFAQFVGTGDFLADTAGLHGYLGFETTLAQRPVSARYTGAGFSTVALAIDGRDDVFPLSESRGADLTAVFTGEGGTISGTLFDQDRPADFDGDGNRDDRLFVRTTLQGTITPEGFTGTIGAAASVSVDGGPQQDLEFGVANSRMTGKFFGPGAGIASGAYAAEGTVRPPGEAPAGATLFGHFWAEDTTAR